MKTGDSCRSGGARNRDITLLVFSGSLPDLIGLDRLQEASSGGQGVEVRVCLCEKARRQPSSLSVPSTPHLRTGTAWLLTFTAPVGRTNRSHLASMAVMPVGEPGLLLQKPRLPEPLKPRSEHCLVLPPLLGYSVPTKSTASPGCLLPLLHSLRWASGKREGCFFELRL